MLSLSTKKPFERHKLRVMIFLFSFVGREENNVPRGVSEIYYNCSSRCLWLLFQISTLNNYKNKSASVFCIKKTFNFLVLFWGLEKTVFVLKLNQLSSISLPQQWNKIFRIVFKKRWNFTVALETPFESNWSLTHQLFFG